MLEENLEQEERKERLENVFFQLDMLRPSSGRKLFYIAGIAFMGLSCLCFGIKNWMLRDKLQQIQSGKGVISRIEYNSLGEKVKELSAQLGTKKTEVERLGLELKVLRAQNKTEAKQTVKLARQIILGMPLDHYKAHAYARLAYAEAQIGMKEESEKSFSQAFLVAGTLRDKIPHSGRGDYGDRHTDGAQSMAYRAIANRYAGLRMYDKAVETAEMISMEGYKSEAYLAIVNVLAESGEPEKAKKIAEKITAKEDKLKAQLMIAVSYNSRIQKLKK